MLRFRPFRNTDPPALTEIWRSRSGQGGLLERVSPDVFEQLIFAKLYFDYDGLLVAWEGDRPLGFAHAGFGPDETEQEISTELGSTCLVMVRPDCPEATVAAGLLERCEEYLRRRGAKVLYGGGVRPLNPFYLGMYGGSELPGILDSDVVGQRLFSSHGYQEIERTLTYRCPLDDFQAVIDRQQMQIRRRMVVEVTTDPPCRTWWEACTLGSFDLTRYELVPRGGGSVVAWTTFRSMEPRGVVGMVRAAGLVELGVEESLRRRGLATFLLSEAMRQFVRQGIMLVEAQVMEHNLAAVRTYQKLGFRRTAAGSVFRKDAS